MTDLHNNVNIGSYVLEVDSSDLDVAMEKADKLKATLQDIKALQVGAAGAPLTEGQIKHMVSRFLQWKLPPDFSPDGGVSFQRDYNQNTPHPAKHEPVGTNLLTATQADAMVRYMLGGFDR